jgi:hypothetical protein
MNMCVFETSHGGPPHCTHQTTSAVYTFMYYLISAKYKGPCWFETCEGGLPFIVPSLHMDMSPGILILLQSHVEAVRRVTRLSGNVNDEWME